MIITLEKSFFLESQVKNPFGIVDTSTVPVADDWKHGPLIQ